MDRHPKQPATLAAEQRARAAKRAAVIATKGPRIAELTKRGIKAGASAAAAAKAAVEQAEHEHDLEATAGEKAKSEADRVKNARRFPAAHAGGAHRRKA